MKYNGSLQISYEKIKLLLNDGIIGEIKSNKKGPHMFAHNGGLYLGAPGKEIYFFIREADESLFEEVAGPLSNLFPKTPPGNHVKWAACIRYICGCFEKQGCLRSDRDKKRMINEKSDWLVPFKFMNFLKKSFEKSNNLYGSVIWHEMYAHRHGDLSLIYPEKRDEYLNTMEQNYLLAQKIGLEIKSWKHCFTPFFWAGCYFYENGIKQKSVEYHLKNLEMINLFCPDARDGYREKVTISLRQIRKSMDKKNWKEWFNRFKRKARNKCLLKVIQ